MSSISLSRIALRPRNSTLESSVMSLREKINVYFPLLGGVSSTQYVASENHLMPSRVFRSASPSRG